MRWPGAHRQPATRPTETDQGRFRPYRPVRQLAVRIGLWALVGLGGCGGVVGMLGVTAPSPAPSTMSTAAPRRAPVEVAGFAQLAVATWVGAGPDDTDELAELFIDAPEAAGREVAMHHVATTAVVGARRIGAGYWAVTVAASVDERVGEVWQPVGTWFVEVGVVAGDRGGLVAVSEPALVPGPPADAAPRPELTTFHPPAAEDHEMVAAIEGFLRAVLIGDGDPSRYVAPGVQIAAVAPAPFSAVRVDAIALEERDEELRARVVVEAMSPRGARRSLGYQLDLARRDGRWEVAAMTGAPSLQRDVDQGVRPPATSTSAPSTTVAVASATGD